MKIRTIGTMAMPADFQYREVFLKGKPQHDTLDPFRVRHPRMDVGHRAKIFAPFDALRGFGSAVSAKNVLYTEKTEQDQEIVSEVNRRLNILKNLTYSRRMAKVNRVLIAVTYYEPCGDENHGAYGTGGQYKTVTGICLNVDDEISRTILVGNTQIGFDSILKIEGNGDLFRKDWDDPWNTD